MLQNLRERFIGTTGKIVLAVILLLLAGTGLNYTVAPQPYVAKVNGDKISLRRVELTFRQLAARFGDQQLPDALRQQLEQVAVDQVISETAMADYLRDAGFAVTDAQLAEQIRSYEDFQTDGSFDRDLYNRLLAQIGTSAGAFEVDERQRMLVNQVRTGLAESSFVTPAEFRRIIELTNEQREVAYATFSPDLYLADITVSEDDITSWYESNPTLYQTEASADVDYLMVDPQLARARVEVSEEELRAYFDANAAQYAGEEERRARHILIRNDEDPTAARALANSLLARIQAGEPFADLARSNSQDGGSASSGGDLGWLSRGDFVGPVEDALFSMRPGATSGIVESEFGLHIIRLEDIRSGDAPSFEQVADEVREQFVAEREAAMLLTLQEQLADQFFESDSLEAVAAALSLEIERADGLTEGAVLPFGVSEEIDALVFGAEPIEVGVMSDPLELSGDRTVLLRVVDRQIAGRQPLAAVRDDIEATLRNRAAREVAAERGAQIAAALSADLSADFEALLAETGASYTAPAPIGRTDGSVPAALAAAVFAAQVPEDGAYVGSVDAPGIGYVVYRVTDVLPGDPAELPPTQIEALRRQLALRQGSTDVLALTQAVIAESSIKRGTALESSSPNF